MAFGSALSVEIDPLSKRKARGAFFTPPALATFIARWAIRESSDAVLEPACGEAEFLLAALDRIRGIGETAETARNQIVGCELHPSSAQEAKARLASRRCACTVEVGDFLAKDPNPVFDAVIGNPPYVRFQAVSAEQRMHMQRIAVQSNVSISALSSTWAPFVVHSASFLKGGGRLGLVLPAELLTVNYAASIRSFLMNAFSSIQLVTFDKRVFPEVQEEVVLLLADGYRSGSSDHIVWRQCRDLDDMYSAALSEYSPTSPEDRWSGIFASQGATDSLDSLMNGGVFTRLDSWGSIALGAVTGNNKYFAMSDGVAEEYGLADGIDLVALCPPGSRHVRRLAFSLDDLRTLQEKGSRTKLFYPQGDTLSKGARAYIKWGESLGVHEAYKCRKRTPWWKVPLSKKPDIFITYMNASGPNLCANDADASGLNSCHGLTLEDGRREIGKDLLPLACLNSATLFGAEVVGRAYGGGMLKLEPREAAKLPVPSLSLVRDAAERLCAVKQLVSDLLGKGDYDGAVSLVDSILFEGIDVIDASDVAHLSASWTLMKLRRKNRSRS